MLKPFCLFIAFMLLGFPGSGQEIAVPDTGSPALLDGRFSGAEWTGARQIRINDSLQLYIKQDREYLYWCLLDRNRKLLGVDFYIAFRDSMVNLHASAKLGERVFRDGDYGEWTWWNQQNWSANVARFNSFEGRRFLPDEAKEFQLLKTRIWDKKLRIMFRLDQPGERPPAFPADATPADPAKWMILKLD